MEPRETQNAEKKQTEKKRKVANKKPNNKSKKKSQQTLAVKRIDELFDEAYKLVLVNPKYANNCVRLARKIALRYKVSFSLEQKLLFCKNCGAYLLPSVTSRVRVQRGKRVVLCLSCKHIKRLIYK